MSQHNALNSCEPSVQVLEIQTSRFGIVQVEADKILHFPDGLLGLPDHKEYCLLPHQPGSPFFWLQSVTTPYLSFIVIDPLLVEPDYLENLPEADRQLFEGVDRGDVIVLALVTIKPEKDPPLTMNLVGPIVVDQQTRTAHQVVLSSTRYTCRHALRLQS